MSLTTSMDVARANLSVLSERTAVISRNITNANNPYASRKQSNTVTNEVGFGSRLATVTRASDKALFESVLNSNASAERYKAIVNGLDRLDQTVNDPELNSSPGALIGRLADQLQQFSAAPNDPIRGQAAVAAATDLVNALTSATDVVQDARSQADAQIADAVDNLNSLLSKFEQVNRSVIQGNLVGADVTDALDSRDELLSDISKEIGIRTIERQNGDLAIYTDSGVTLFETAPRTVSFSGTLTYGASTTGNAVSVDGVAVTGNNSILPIGSGRIRGLAEFRDDYAVTYQNQLDEIARGLIESFAESDQSGGGGPDQTGLFVYSGSPAVPGAGTLVPGIAREISVNAAVDPTQGGDPTLLRDGGINGAAYVYNLSGAAGFNDRLLELNENLYSARAFDVGAQAGTNTTIVNFSSNSVGWLGHSRQTAAAEYEFRSVLQERAAESLSKETGVNLDHEMTLMLELERSYQATARLIATIDNMYAALLLAAG